MPISEKQSAENHRLTEKAFANKVKVRVTGKLLERHAESGEWLTSTKDAPASHKKIVWGWMGKKYGADEKGYMREILADGFGDYIPEDAFIHHNRVIRTNDTHELKLEVVKDKGVVKSVDGMSMSELRNMAKDRGLTDADLKTMSQGDLVSLLSK